MKLSQICETDDPFEKKGKEDRKARERAERKQAKALAAARKRRDQIRKSHEQERTSATPEPA